jgi:hypothetical protein
MVITNYEVPRYGIFSNPVLLHLLEPNIFLIVSFLTPFFVLPADRGTRLHICRTSVGLADYRLLISGHTSFLLKDASIVNTFHLF